MKKFFTLCGLSLMALMPWEGVMAENLTTLDVNAEGRIFTIKTERGYWYADGTQNRISASKGDLSSLPINGVDFANSTEMSRFTVVKATNEDRYYLYNIDHSKWVRMNGNNLGLYAVPFADHNVALAATTGERVSTYPSCIYFGGSQVNMYGVSPANTPDVVKYQSLDDQGNNSLLQLNGASVETTVLTTLKAQVDAAMNRVDVINTKTIGKKFTIGGERGYWKSEVDNNWVSYTTDANQATKYAIVDVDGRNFLYDADNNRWVTPASGTPADLAKLALSVDPTLAEVGLAYSTYTPTTGSYPVVITFFYGSRQYGISTAYTPKVISYNNLGDAGNAAALTMNGENVDLNTLRNTIRNTYVTPYVLSSGNDPSKWVWHHVTLRGKYMYVDDTTTPKLSAANATNFADADAYLWAFLPGDNPDYTRFSVQIYNKKLGSTKNLKGNGQMGNAIDANDNLIISMGGTDGSGFNIRTSKDVNNTNYMNDAGNQGSLGFWNNAGARTDEGSCFRVELAEGFVTLQNFMAASGRNTAYGYMGANAEGTGLVGGVQSVGLQQVAQITPTASPGKVNLFFEGKRAQTVAQSNQATLGETVVEYKMGRATYYPFYITLGTGTGQYEYLHEAASQSHKVVGWETSAGATNWKVAPAQDIQMTANAVGSQYYATLYAPFALQISGATAYTAKVNDAKSALVLTEVPNGLIPANTGVVVVADADTYSVTPVQSALSSIDTDLVGVNAATTWDSDNLSLGRNNGVAGFYKWNGTTLAANKAYLPASKLSESGARGLAFDFGGTTAIQGVETQNGKTGKVYNLQGQQVGDNYRGIVIVNGKKVIK
ncbi:MAG: hypothetical protein SPF56_03295 [Bacteroidaceae bacterium]|nr:hypothetical protein [Bacteroidaceae bacterium]